MILNDKCIFASWASILDLLLFIYFSETNICFGFVRGGDDFL